MLYQLWLFVAAGLYPHERKYITRYLPLSIALLISGMLFVYFLVLPWTLQFFLAFSISIPLPQDHTPATTMPATPPLVIGAVPGDPPKPVEGQIWINTLEGRLKMFVNGTLRVLPFGPQNLTAPMLTLPDYIDMVVAMLLTFGLCFQLPLVVLALIRIGIIELDAMKKARRYVYFGMSILAAAITPGDVITATVALMVPLIFLFELGIFLAQWGHKSSPPAAKEDSR
jgi:sec-independent protein translocase protein TatC